MPLPVVSVEQMREWERLTWSGGQTEAEVIRRVGMAVANRALELTGPQDLIVILAGKGNNGEDARCAREHLPGRRIDVIDLSGSSGELEKLQALLSLHPALVIDGVFGIGLNRPLTGAWLQIVEAVNAACVPVLAIDVPSGLNAETGEPEGAAIRSQVTLTVGAPKNGLLKETAWPFVGRLEVTGNVGLAPCPYEGELQWTLPEDFDSFPPARPAASHKGTYGHLAIIAGTLGYHGAAVLAARAAQHAQPGLITLFTSERTYEAVAAHLQAVMVHPIDKRTDFSTYDAVVIGPGLAAPEQAENFKTLTKEIWANAPKPVIVDASALAWLPSGEPTTRAIRVITPHPGEAARLLRTGAEEIQKDRARALRNLSKAFGDCFVVLKGHQTLIGRGAGEAITVNSSGNPHLAQGGSGDALSGYLGGLLTQPRLQADPRKTFAYAVWQHGAAADWLQKEKANWIVEDLVSALGSAPGRFKQEDQEAQEGVGDQLRGGSLEQ